MLRSKYVNALAEGTKSHLHEAPPLQLFRRSRLLKAEKKSITKQMTQLAFLIHTSLAITHNIVPKEIKRL